MLLMRRDRDVAYNGPPGVNQMTPNVIWTNSEISSNCYMGRAFYSQANSSPIYLVCWCIHWPVVVQMLANDNLKHQRGIRSQSDTV